MNDKNLETKLTPAARQVFEELERDFRNQLLRSASKSAASLSGEVQEISVKDLLNALDTIRLSRQKQVNTRIFNFGKQLVVLGLVISFFAVINSLYFLVGFWTRSESELGVLIGLATSLYGFMFQYVAEHPRILRLFSLEKATPVDSENERNSTLLFMEKWREIELKMKAKASENYGESKANLPLSTLAKNFRNQRILTDQDLKLFDELLSVRNKIVHEGFAPDKVVSLSVINRADKLLNKLG